MIGKNFLRGENFQLIYWLTLCGIGELISSQRLPKIKIIFLSELPEL